MNAFNRLVIIILLLALGALLFLVLAYPGPEVALALATSGLQSASQFLAQSRQNVTVYQGGRALLALVGLLILLFLLYLELRRPQRRAVQLQMPNGTIAQLTTD